MVTSDNVKDGFRRRNPAPQPPPKHNATTFHGLDSTNREWPNSHIADNNGKATISSRAWGEIGKDGWLDSGPEPIKKHFGSRYDSTDSACQFPFRR
jgi:hypothetical protein